MTPRAGREAASVRTPVGAERSVLGARVSVTPRAGRDAARDRQGSLIRWSSEITRATYLTLPYPLGGPLGSATHVLWARVCGRWGPALSPWPACPAGAACRGGVGGPSLGGVACHRCEGRLVSGAVPPPVARPLGRAAGVPRPVCPGCGRCGRGGPEPASQRAPLRAGVARSGGGGRASLGGVPSTVARGV